MNIYVGNLPTSTNEEEVTNLFSAYGNVNSAKLIKDFETGELKGFGFIEMSQSDGNKAIEALNGSEFGGKFLTVNEAYERRSNNNFNRGRDNGGYRRNNR